MSELPKGWVEVEWNQITATDGFRRGPFGGNLKKDCFVDDGYAVYEQYAPINDDCNSFRYFITEDKYNELSGFHVGHGDFLISCSGTMGKITHVPKGAPKGVINQALLRIRLQDNFVQPDYFLRLFRSPTLQGKVLNKVVGGAIQNLAAVAELKKIKLPVAPINEQTRIVEKLDEVLAQVDTIKARLDGIPAILKRFRQSVLAAAVSGRLTEEWRKTQNSDAIKEFSLIAADRVTVVSGKNKQVQPHLKSEEYPIPDSWFWVSLDALTRHIVDGTHHTPTYIESGIPFISVKDIKNGVIDFSDTKFISEEEHVELSKRCCVEKGDLLITKSGTIGRTAIVNTDREFSLFVSVALLKPASSLVNMRFVNVALQKWINEIDVSSRIVGSAIKNLHLRDMRVLAIPFAPLEEQKEIVRLVDQYFAFADTIAAQVKKAQTRVDNLTQSILAKAFRGELVAQDPSDEPAEKLLERIAQARKEAEALAKAANKVAKTK